MTVRERQASVRARRKEYRRKMLRLYSWRGMIVSLLILITILMICGVLYIKEYLTCEFEKQLDYVAVKIYTA